MRKILIICGPTATGKTDIGVKLSQKFDGEIVSADSRQVYQGMDILTGKDIPSNSKLNPPAGGQNSKLGINKKNISVGYRLKDNIPVWLLDIVPPDYDFNVSDYSFLAKSVIIDIWKRNKLTVIVGGTGFYINSIINNYDTVNIPRNEILRKELDLLETEQLQQRLKEIDRKKINSMNNSDINNPRRLVRSIEVAVWKNDHSGKVKADNQLMTDSRLLIGLTSSKEKIQKNIEARVNKRIKEGAIIEVKKILEKYKDSVMISTATTGFKELVSYVKGECLLSDAVRLWIKREQQYANRQLVWFKKVKDILWYNVDDSEAVIKIEETIRKWYTSS